MWQQVVHYAAYFPLSVTFLFGLAGIAFWGLSD